MFLESHVRKRQQELEDHPDRTGQAQEFGISRQKAREGSERVRVRVDSTNKSIRIRRTRQERDK